MTWPTGRSPLPPRPPKPAAEFIPYIYSEPDMRALLEAVDARHEEDWLVRPTTVRTLLLLLYATGLRISEALALTNTDMDLAEAILMIRETKFYKSRLVPIGADLVGVLARYRDQPHKKPGRRPDGPFLVDRDGRRILRHTAELIFKHVREQAGLERPPCRTFQPRLHDFRHTFATARAQCASGVWRGWHTGWETLVEVREHCGLDARNVAFDVPQRRHVVVDSR